MRGGGDQVIAITMQSNQWLFVTIGFGIYNILNFSYTPLTRAEVIHTHSSRNYICFTLIMYYSSSKIMKHYQATYNSTIISVLENG